MNPGEVAAAVLAEARHANERRLLAVAGDRTAVTAVVERMLDSIDIPINETVAVGPDDRFRCPHLEPERSTELMGTTRTVVVLDLHHAARPNVIGRATGAVDGEGLLILLCPAFAAWPHRRDAFDEGLVVEPFSLEDVRGLFKRRLVDCLQTHPGVAVYDAGSGTIERDGLTDPPAYDPPRTPDQTAYGEVFPGAWYDRCLTTDQAATLETFERLAGDPVAIVASAERGRGKSSAAGIAAAALAESGLTVGVTAPERANLRAFFARIDETRGGSTKRDGEVRSEGSQEVTYRDPLAAVKAAERGQVDVLFVDEAAGLPVRTLERLLACPRIAFTTTRHGYEGSGHGFATRFRDTLDQLDRPVIDVTLNEPIRYASGDPIESFLNRLLLLDARPPVDAVVEEATPAGSSIIRPSPDELAEDDDRLRAVMGLLAHAHYRTDPDDLARVLDAPNLSIMGIQRKGHLIAVSLIAREGNLPAERVESAYRGERLRGNMLPDVFCGMLRDDELAGRPGARVVRIATHGAVRRRGLGSRLLDAVRSDLADQVDWLGTGFGATPGVVRFWTENGFVPIAVSASRNRASGAHSTILLDGQTGEEKVVDSLAKTFRVRARDSLSDVHRSVDPGVVSELLRAVAPLDGLELTERQWRGLVAAADGPGRYEHDPGPARDLTMRGMCDDAVDVEDRTRRVLVGKVLQGRNWETIAAAESFAAESTVKRTVGQSLVRLLDEYGPPIVDAERRRLGNEQ